MSTNEKAALGCNREAAQVNPRQPGKHTEGTPSRKSTPVTAPGAGRYHPPLERLLRRRHRRIVAAALRLEEAHVAVQEARRDFDRGTPERRQAFHERAQARESLFYHVRELRRENPPLGGVA